MGEKLTIGRVAKQAGVNIQTIRYYERRGILTPDGHRDSGYRLYAPEAVRKIRFIKNAQELGFTLREIAELLRLRVARGASCAKVKKKAELKLRDVSGKIARLDVIKRVLKKLVRTCSGKVAMEECPVLECLDEGVMKDKCRRGGCNG